MVLCRLCERHVPHGEFMQHAPLCVAAHNMGHESRAAMKVVSGLRASLVEAQCKVMARLLEDALIMYLEVGSPLRALVREAGALLALDSRQPSPGEHSRELVRVTRSISKLQQSAGGAVFHSCAAQFKTIASQQIALVQNLIALDPSGSVIGSTEASRPRQLVVGIGDFVLLRRLGAGSFAQVWMAQKKSTSDVYAIKAIRK